MFRSIRWRLIISYILLALLVVGVVGTITYQLAKNYAETRELQRLRVNAQAIAQKAELLIYSRFGMFDLQQLAETSAFLGDVRVRILDNNQRPIADSGISNKSEQVMLFVPGVEGEIIPGMIFYHFKTGTPFKLPETLIDVLPQDTSITIVRRKDGPWGNQFTFEEIIVSEQAALDVDTVSQENSFRSNASVLQPIGEPSNPLGYVELSEPLDVGSNLLDELRQALVTAGVGAVMLSVLFGLWNS